MDMAELTVFAPLLLGPVSDIVMRRGGLLERLVDFWIFTVEVNPYHTHKAKMAYTYN